MKREYCQCILHYVCYMGTICMNIGCRKPHQFVKKYPKKIRDEIFNDIKGNMIVNNIGEPVWAQKDGSVEDEFYSPYERRYNERMANKKWWQFWK